jgi:hypothetical protein
VGKGRARNLAKEAAWRRRLDRHAESGQSVRAWCRRHRVQEAAFYWWRRELARRDTARRVSIRRDGEGQATSFVPVHVTEEPARDGDSPIEIVLTDGRRVRVTGPVNGQALADVLDVLERRAC